MAMSKRLRIVLSMTLDTRQTIRIVTQGKNMGWEADLQRLCVQTACMRQW